MRSVVSYDDLEQITTTHAPGPPPAKKRKRQQNKRKSSGPQKFAHWDEPVENHEVSFTEHDYAGDLEGETTDVEGRELTHEEIWDDSALIEAWDAAMNEYKVCRNLTCLIFRSYPLGIPRISEQVEDRTHLEILSTVSATPLQSWRYSPRSRWYNVPPSASGTTGAGAGLELSSSIHERRESHIMPMSEHDSVPLNFNTFVPSHDPALPNLAAGDTQNLIGISQDEAFRNALNSMYWTGYWTAVYHVRVSPPTVSDS